MKLFSTASVYYLISLGLHLVVFFSLVASTFKPMLPVGSFKTTVYFEPAPVQHSATKAPKRTGTRGPRAEIPLSRKLDLVPRINTKRPTIPETEPLQAPSLKKYITPPKSSSPKSITPSGYLRSNKRTEKPVLPLISAQGPTGGKQADTAGSAASESDNKVADPQLPAANTPYIPDPSYTENETGTSTDTKNKMSALWQKKSDLAIYRTSLAKIVTANWIVPPTSVRDFRILIEAHIGPRGNLINIQPLESSGLAILDAAAERAIRVSTPFPEFPNSFGEDIKVYRAVFRFTPDKVAN
ncbi:TonB C-terminal domain-containing protein [bacterium]|nr:TonB C-terminal domain-containing protein [bacterium]